jgi:hypothetical protein
MTTITRSDIQRVAVSAFGALLVSTACIGAAIFPAKAAEETFSTAAGWQTEVEKRIDNALQSPTAQSPKVVMAEVAMKFDERGAFRSATLLKSSGIEAVDREAVRTANALRYPDLPVYLQGKPQNVAMQIFFGNQQAGVSEAQAKARRAATALAAKEDTAREQAQIAAQPTG